MVSCLFQIGKFIDNKENMMNKVEFTQRKYDGKWVMWSYEVDPTIDFEDFRGREMLIPYRWVPRGVYDYIVEFE
jgi:hypothetical protein